MILMTAIAGICSLFCSGYFFVFPITSICVISICVSAMSTFNAINRQPTNFPLAVRTAAFSAILMTFTLVGGLPILHAIYNATYKSMPIKWSFLFSDCSSMFASPAFYLFFIFYGLVTALIGAILGSACAARKRAKKRSQSNAIYQFVVRKTAEQNDAFKPDLHVFPDSQQLGSG